MLSWCLGKLLNAVKAVYFFIKMATSNAIQLILKRSTSNGSHIGSEEWRNALPFKLIPGPKSNFLIGNIWRFLPAVGDLYNLDTTQLHVELNKRYGNIVKLEGLPGKPPLVFLSNADDVAKVFHTEGKFPVRDAMQSTRYYRDFIRPDPYRRVGHLVDHGEQWKKFRTRVNKVLLKPGNVVRLKQGVEEITDDFMRRIRGLRDGNNEMPKDFMFELKKWALEVLGVISLDHRFGCLGDSLSPEAVKITQAVEDFHRSAYELDFIPFPMWKYVSTPSFNRMVTSLDHLHDVSETYVSQLENVQDGVQESDCILQRVVSGGGDSRDVAVVMAVDMFLAGVEIIAGMAGTLLYALSKNSSEQQKLAEKVNSLTEKDYLPFVQAFIKETLRLWPIAIGTIRTARQDIVLSGFQIPEGSVLFNSNYIMCRSQRYFANPLVFDPSRWLGEDKLDFSQYAFAPFGIGIRSCIGRRIAMLELETFLTKIVTNFVVEYNYGEMEFESRFLNLISTPLQFKLSDRMV